jgi:hypothetical protein
VPEPLRHSAVDFLGRTPLHAAAQVTNSVVCLLICGFVVRE